MSSKKNIAVVLSGCGHLDGSEIRESLFTLLSLDQYLQDSARVQIFAPDMAQHDVVNHLDQQQSSKAESRSVLVESARLARGSIERLDRAEFNQLDGLILPGGFGAAKNLSSFARDGAKAKVEPQLKAMIESLYERKKPIAAICIAPAILALVLGKHGIQLSIGDDANTAAVLEELGAKHQNKAVDEICLDKNHRIVTTPAYMYGEAALRDVHRGIANLVEAFVELL